MRTFNVKQGRRQYLYDNVKDFAFVVVAQQARFSGASSERAKFAAEFCCLRERVCKEQF